MLPSVHIIILNWNNAPDTMECLETVQKVTYPEFKIVLIDNGSTDGSSNALEDRAKSLAVPVHFIRLPKNVGFAAGNNVGIQYALGQQAEYVLLLNNDTTVPADLLERLVETAQRTEKLGILGCRIDRYQTQDICFDGGVVSFWRGAGYHLLKPLREPFESTFITGCLMLIPVPVLKEVGLFDERFFLGWEDIDLSYQVRKSGYRLVVDPRVVIWHKVSRSVGGRYSLRSQYYFHRNRMMFFNKHLSGVFKVVFFATQFLIMIPAWIVVQSLCGRFEVVRVAFKGYRDYFKGTSGHGYA